jgi:hypothetical protein
MRRLNIKLYSFEVKIRSKHHIVVNDFIFQKKKMIENSSQDPGQLFYSQPG